MSIEIRDPIVFPSVVGLDYSHAADVAEAAGVVLVDFDPDAPPIGTALWPHPHLISEQDPGPGTSGRARASLRIRVKRIY